MRGLRRVKRGTSAVSVAGEQGMKLRGNAGKGPGQARQSNASPELVFVNDFV